MTQSANASTGYPSRSMRRNSEISIFRRHSMASAWIIAVPTWTPEMAAAQMAKTGCHLTEGMIIQNNLRIDETCNLRSVFLGQLWIFSLTIIMSSVNHSCLVGQSLSPCQILVLFRTAQFLFCGLKKNRADDNHHWVSKTFEALLLRSSRGFVGLWPSQYFSTKSQNYAKQTSFSLGTNLELFFFGKI